MSLRKKLAEHGFESNDDYEYPLRCLFEADVPHLRCVHVAGDSGRRKTAFANALAHALEYPHILYHDFTQPELASASIVVTSEDKEHPQPLEAPLTLFERSVTEACAYSEGARTILILDQLHTAEFRDHIRLYHFAQNREWGTAQGSVIANPKHLLLALISEQPLYHSLAKVSFRIHTDATRALLDYKPADFGLPRTAVEFMAELAQVFQALGASPTPSEYARILQDIHKTVRTEEQLRCTLYGWMENLDHAVLYAQPLQVPLAKSVHAINRYLGLEEIELGS